MKQLKQCQCETGASVVSMNLEWTQLCDVCVEL